MLRPHVGLALLERLFLRLHARIFLGELPLARGERPLALGEALLLLAQGALALGQRTVTRLLAGLHLGLAARDVLLAADELRLLRVQGLSLLGELGRKLFALAVGVLQLLQLELDMVGALCRQRLGRGQACLELGQPLALLPEVLELLARRASRSSTSCSAEASLAARTSSSAERAA